MKNFLLFLSVMFTFLFCTTTVNGALVSEERGQVDYCMQSGEFFQWMDTDEEPAGFFLPVQSDSKQTMSFEDAQSLARQLRLVNRGQRQLVVHYTLLDKALLAKVAKSCMDAIYSSTNQNYTSLPYQSWGVSSEHYVFGMRRILI